jgi:hypothetical protein
VSALAQIVPLRPIGRLEMLHTQSRRALLDRAFPAERLAAGGLFAISGPRDSGKTDLAYALAQARGRAVLHAEEALPLPGFARRNADAYVLLCDEPLTLSAEEGGLLVEVRDTTTLPIVLCTCDPDLARRLLRDDERDTHVELSRPGPDALQALSEAFPGFAGDAALRERAGRFMHGAGLGLKAARRACGRANLLATIEGTALTLDHLARAIETAKGDP